MSDGGGKMCIVTLFAPYFHYEVLQPPQSSTLTTQCMHFAQAVITKAYNRDHRMLYSSTRTSLLNSKTNIYAAMLSRESERSQREIERKIINKLLYKPRVVTHTLDILLFYIF